jgi:L-lactate dehydrogenase complex protein LldF
MKGNTSQTAYSRFLADSRTKAFDKTHRRTINYNMMCYDEAVQRGKAIFARPELARRRAALKKHSILENLEDHLKNFERQFTSRGGKLIWAQDAEEVKKAVLEIFEQHFVKKVVKSKSMVTEETGLTEFLEKNGIECVETDLGEYIVQISDDKPYHIVTPAMHLSAGDVAKIFNEQFGLSENATPQEITAFVRQKLREKFKEAQAGITGANFLVSGSGAVAITENEGNALFSMSAPNIHIVLTGIEKLIPGTEDLDLFWPLLATHGTGQEITAYNSLVFGPKKPGETDGPEHMYVILLDNGRSRLLAATPQRRNLACIRCGACLNACPVYRNIGGHAYGTVYSGPIGAIISPHLTGKLAEYKHLSYASSLCGKCTEVCPAGIDLHHQLLHNRHLFMREGLSTRTERFGIKAYKRAMGNRKWLDLPSPGLKNFAAKILFSQAWGKKRSMPKVVKSFKKRYSEK